jgi:hypothetical protein
MTVFVLTYNTNDNPERRIIWGVYDSMEKAKTNKQKIIKQYGSFLADTEIDEREVE